MGAGFPQAGRSVSPPGTKCIGTVCAGQQRMDGEEEARKVNQVVSSIISSILEPQALHSGAI